MTHPDHADVYAHDVFVSGFAVHHLSRFLDIICENQPQDGFVAAEIGAGTGGLTRQVSTRPRSWHHPLSHMQAPAATCVPFTCQIARRQHFVSLQLVERVQEGAPVGGATWFCSRCCMLFDGAFCTSDGSRSLR